MIPLLAYVRSIPQRTPHQTYTCTVPTARQQTILIRF